MIEKVFSIDIAAPVQRVWDEITRRGAPHPAVFGSYLHVDLRPGATMSYRNRSGARTLVLGEVLDVQAPRRLVHTFRFSLESDEPTVVAWELTEHQGGTRVTITHSRLVEESRTARKISGGWPRILRYYKQFIETGTVPMGKRIGNAVMGAMCCMLPKRTRTENAMKLNLKVPAA